MLTPLYKCLDDPICLGTIVQWPNGSLCEYVLSGYEGSHSPNPGTNLTVRILSVSLVLRSGHEPLQGPHVPVPLRTSRSITYPEYNMHASQALR